MTRLIGGALPRPMIVMVTDRRKYAAGGDGDLIRAVRRAVRAGVDFVQLRERGMEDNALLALARRVTHVTDGSSARTLINDRLDVALAAGADGVHLPAGAVSGRRVREVAPEGFIVGRSVHSEDEARIADRDGGCDYLIFGSVFESTSKPAGHAVGGLDGLSRVCAAVSVPVVAIGGVTPDRVADVARAGAAGIAAITLFADVEREQVIETVRQIRAAFEPWSSSGH